MVGFEPVTYGQTKKKPGSRKRPSKAQEQKKQNGRETASQIALPCSEASPSRISLQSMHGIAFQAKHHIDGAAGTARCRHQDRQPVEARKHAHTHRLHGRLEHCTRVNWLLVPLGDGQTRGQAQVELDGTLVALCHRPGQSAAH